jgi:hypothetical protein
MRIVLIVTLLFIQFASFSQDQTFQEKEFRSGIIIKSTPLPFLFETIVGGNLKVNQESISFIPFQCSEDDKNASSLMPCNDHLIKNVILNFSDVTKIKRRSFLFLFPNRIFVKKSTGEAYIFTTYRRRSIIDNYNNYKIQRVSPKLE